MDLCVPVDTSGKQLQQEERRATVSAEAGANAGLGKEKHLDSWNLES